MRVILLLSVLLFGIAGNAHATLLGDTVTCSNTDTIYPCTPTSAIVTTSSPEFLIGAPASGSNRLAVDLDAHTLVFTSVYPSLSSLDPFVVTIGDIDGAAGNLIIAGIDNVFDNSVIGTPSVSFAAHSVTVDFAGTLWNPDQYLSFDLVFRAVSEPSVIGLLIMGFIGLGFARRKRLAA